MLSSTGSSPTVLSSSALLLGLGVWHCWNVSVGLFSAFFSSLVSLAVPAATASGSLSVLAGVCSAGFLFSAPVHAPFFGTLDGVGAVPALAATSEPLFISILPAVSLWADELILLVAAQVIIPSAPHFTVQLAPVSIAIAAPAFMFILLPASKFIFLPALKLKSFSVCTLILSFEYMSIFPLAVISIQLSPLPCAM